jgi:hypothetical protein
MQNTAVRGCVTPANLMPFIFVCMCMPNLLVISLVVGRLVTRRQAIVTARIDWSLSVVQMDLGFRQVDAEGRPIRRTAAQVAAIMGLPEKRCVTADLPAVNGK